MPQEKYKKKLKIRNTPGPVHGKERTRKTGAAIQKQKQDKEIADLVKNCPKSKIPDSVEPMLCTLTKEVLEDQRFLYEIKWDGYRIVAYVQSGRVRMDSRSALDYTLKYPPVAEALKALGHDVVLDGEVVVFNQEGLPDFDALQKFNGHDTPISYCVFDILWLDGCNLMGFPLTTRKSILEELIGNNEVIRFSESFDNGKGLYEQMLEKNLEGIVAKKKDSPYVPGQRADNWLKTPTRKRQEFVIGGWAESDKNRSFKSLLFGAYNKGKFEWIGRSGGGYKEKDMPGIQKDLKALEINHSPFVNKVLDTKGAPTHWVKPKLVANFEFATWTKTGRIRKPATFLGFRKDKKPEEVVREVPKGTAVIEKEIDEEFVAASASEPRANTKIKQSKASTSSSNWIKIENQKIKDEQDFNIGDCTIKINDVEREIWTGITKADLITYYHQVSKYLLPYLKYRPQSLHIKPVNAGAPGFYIKDMEGRQPDCASLFTDSRRHAAKGKADEIHYLVCNNEATLLWMINLGCIDINPWNSRKSAPDNPDYIAIDLDPTVEAGKAMSRSQLKMLLDTAMAAKAFLDSQKLKAFAKTSGKTGMHFFIPCTGFTSPEARKLAELICTEIHELAPGASTTANAISSRAGKVYVDPSQNDYADTLAAVYSVRPFHSPTVSTALEWKEINGKLDPDAFTMDAVISRLRKKGDLFKGLLDKKTARSNSKILKGLA